MPPTVFPTCPDSASPTGDAAKAAAAHDSDLSACASQVTKARGSGEAAKCESGATPPVKEVSSSVSARRRIVTTVEVERATSSEEKSGRGDSAANPQQQNNHNNNHHQNGCGVLVTGLPPRCPAHQSTSIPLSKTSTTPPTTAGSKKKSKKAKKRARQMQNAAAAALKSDAPAAQFSYSVKYFQWAVSSSESETEDEDDDEDVVPVVTLPLSRLRLSERSVRGQGQSGGVKGKKK